VRKDTDMENSFTYTYNFEYGIYNTNAGISDTAAIEVDGYWHGVLKELDRAEYNDAHRENRRHVSYERLELLDDYLIPQQLFTDDNNPAYRLSDKAKRKAYFVMYDKILRGAGILTEKQFQAFQYRLLCDAPFGQVAYFMRFDFLPANESISLAKKHYYAAIKKLRKRFMPDYKKLKKDF
jgi:hypothetical protein